MENSKCITSVAFREPYLTHNLRQNETIPDGIKIFNFIDELPYKEGIVKENIVSRFQKSLYGFKPHAIQMAIDNSFKLVIWFDPSVLPTSNINDLFLELKETDMLVIKGDKPINSMANDKAFNWFGLDKNDTINVNHIGGTFYGFNFNNPKTVEVFNLWKKAEEDGIFGTQDDFMIGNHWCDESCMALAMHKVGIEQKTSTTLKYLNQKDLPL